MADKMDTHGICEREVDCEMLAGASKSELDYYHSIDKCAAEESNKYIENGMPAHATYLMLKMFQKAKHEVRLFSGSLCLSRSKDDTPNMEKVYSSSELIRAAVSFVKDRNGTLNIILEKDIDGGLETHPLIIALKENGATTAGRVTVRRLNGDAQLQDSRHFMVMDNRAYRVEYDDKNTKAFANFGDSITATKWVHYFDRILALKSTELNAINCT